jgi:hypothetical protein
MAVNISCPACGVRGELPEHTPPDAVLTCQRCGVRFTAPPSATPPPPPRAAADDGLGLSVWVGDGTEPPLPTVAPAPPPAPALTPQNAAAHLDWVRAETERFEQYVTRQLGVLAKMREQITAFETKTRAEAVQRDQAAARERALIAARAAELDAQATGSSATLTAQAAELQAELDRQVAVQKEHLARRAEAVAAGERELERARAELGRTTGEERRAEQAELERLRAENAGLRAEIAELQTRAAGQDETIARMMAAGQRLIKQRDELRAKVPHGDRTAT